MAVLRDQVGRGRRGGLRSSDMVPASLTITTLGDRGAEEVHGVIHPPQVALVGFGRITERPWVADGRVAVHRTATVTLAADHRASDGRTGSRFLRIVEQVLTDPDRLDGADSNDDRGAR
jgi:pyruvate dehydrogenase E2 component (dihydrolipoamide acetyltransferase)